MRDILPSLTAEEAEQALIKANGQLYEAVDWILGQASESGVRVKQASLIVTIRHGICRHCVHTFTPILTKHLLPPSVICLKGQTGPWRSLKPWSH